MKNIKTKTVKRHSFLVVFVTAILFSFTTCKDDDFIFNFIAREDNDYTLPSPPSTVVDIMLNKNTLYMFKGRTETLTATFINTDLKAAVSWSSTDTDVASVDNKGKVTAEGFGAAVITATTTDGGKTAVCAITVIEKKFEMVSIPAGTFKMGSPDNESESVIDEHPQHSVTLTAFYMGKYEVTQEQYHAVMGNNPSGFSSDPEAGEIQDKRPVEKVTWYDAVEFCNKLSVLEELQSVYKISGRTPSTGYPIISAEVTADFTKNGYRLPTEAQWEYACRAGTTTEYNTGDTVSDNTGWYGWYRHKNTDEAEEGNSGRKTHEVGKKPANAWGLCDMNGNVWEWCWDWYDPYYYSSSPANDPTGSSSGVYPYRVARGGSWNYAFEYMRSACRACGDPRGRGSLLGFRLVLPNNAGSIPVLQP